MSTTELDTAVSDVETAVDGALSVPPVAEDLAGYNALSVRLSAAASRLAAAAGEAYAAATAPEDEEAGIETQDAETGEWSDETAEQTAAADKAGTPVGKAKSK